MKFLEQNKDFLFPNDDYSSSDVEKALLLAPDEFEIIMNNFPFRSPATAKKIAKIAGTNGLDYYLGDFNVKPTLFGVLFMFYRSPFRAKKAEKLCRQRNCKWLIDSIKDKNVVLKLLEDEEKIKARWNFVKVATPVAIEAIKGAKEIRNTFL